jgi:putative CocE/NonD family hydrolase
MRSITVERDHIVTMPDGVRLYTDVYRPDAAGPHPTLIYRVRGSKDLSFITGALMVSPVLAADRGYAVVIQQVRGRNKSEGDWHPFVHERSDGLTTLDWVLDQPWCNGRVGTYGSAYAGACALQLTASGHPAVEACVGFVTGANYHDGWISNSGAFELGWANFWAYLTSGESLRRLGLTPAETEQRMAALKAATTSPMQQMERLPLKDQPALEGISPHYQTWLEHPSYDAYWQEIDVVASAADIKAKVLNITGWWDNFLGSHLDLDAALAEHSPAGANRRLVIGPWDHFTYVGVIQTRAGAKDFGPPGVSGASVIGSMTLDWFDRWLRDAPPTEATSPGTRYFVPGPDVWRNAESWPPAHNPTPWFLHPGGLVDTTVPSSGSVGTSYEYDPADPTPTIGGRTLMPSVAEAGVQDVSDLANRSDVLVFDSELLENGVEIAGPVSADLFVSTTAQDTDFVVTLADLDPDGSAEFIADGIVRGRYRHDQHEESWFVPDRVEELTVNMWAAAWRFPKGHRIRIMVASASFPRFNRSLNTKASLSDGTLDDAEVATQTIYHDAKRASSVTLPMTDPESPPCPSH